MFPVTDSLSWLQMYNFKELITRYFCGFGPMQVCTTLHTSDSPFSSERCLTLSMLHMTKVSLSCLVEKMPLQEHFSAQSLA